MVHLERQWVVMWWCCVVFTRGAMMAMGKKRNKNFKFFAPAIQKPLIYFRLSPGIGPAR